MKDFSAIVRIGLLLPLSAAAAHAGVVSVSNRDELLDRRVFVPPHPSESRPQAEDTGFLAVGHFNGLPDAVIQSSTGTVTGIAALAASWQQFGPADAVGVDRRHGIFDFTVEAPVTGGGSFDGKPIYLVIGDASTFARSPSLLIYKTDRTFQADDIPLGGGGGLIPPPVSVLLSPSSGTLVAGSFAAAQYRLAASAKPTEREYLDSFKPECPTADLDDVLADPDGDGLSNREEYSRCTNPCQADTDLDGLTDKQEHESQVLAVASQVDPLHPDTDADGAPDGIEEFYGFPPNDALSSPPLHFHLRHVWPMDGHNFDLFQARRLQPSLLSPALAYESGTWHRCAVVTGPDPATPQSLSASPVVSPSAGGFGLHTRIRVEEFTQPGQLLVSQGATWSLRRSGSTDRLRFTFGNDLIESLAAVEVAPSGTLSSPETQPMHRIAVSVFFGQYMEFWIDGQRQGKIPLTGTNRLLGAASLASPLTVSSATAAQAARLRLDDTAWWDRPLTPADVSVLDAETAPAWDLPAPRDPWQIECILRESGNLTLAWPVLGERTRYNLLRSADMTAGSWSTIAAGLDVPVFTDTVTGPRFFYRVEEVP